MGALWEKGNYRANVHFVIDNLIREYDITKANISILRDAGILSEEQYQYFLVCPRMEREVAIGKLQGGNTEVTAILKDGIAQARRCFLEANGISDNEILAIRNDAITVVGTRPISTLAVSDRVHFREDGRYTSYYYLGMLDFYYFASNMSDAEYITVKGLGELATAVHKDYMLDLLSELFYTAQFDGIPKVIYTLSHVFENYINRRFPVEYYRELNPQSAYKLLSMSQFSTFYMDYALEPQKPLIDISYNCRILRELNQIYSSIYFRR